MAEEPAAGSPTCQVEVCPTCAAVLQLLSAATEMVEAVQNHLERQERVLEGLEELFEDDPPGPAVGPAP